MRKHLDKSMTSGRFLHIHTHLNDDSVVCVFRRGSSLFDVTTERKQGSSLGDPDMTNSSGVVSCWCHGRSCPDVVFFLFLCLQLFPARFDGSHTGNGFPFCRNECFTREMWFGDERRTRGHPKLTIASSEFFRFRFCVSIPILFRFPVLLPIW